MLIFNTILLLNCLVQLCNACPLCVSSSLRPLLSRLTVFNPSQTIVARSDQEQDLCSMQSLCMPLTTKSHIFAANQGGRLTMRLYSVPNPETSPASTSPQLSDTEAEENGDDDVQAFLRSKGFIQEPSTSTEPEPLDDSESSLKSLMLSAIQWYRNTLSPLMPANCRFLPSCSNYAIDAIKKFGPWKGGVLTAWRLVRCNPIGGAGYDSPTWPPPSYFAGTNTFPKKK